MEREWWPRRSHLIHLSVHSKVTDWLCAGVWWIRQMRAGWHFSIPTKALPSWLRSVSSSSKCLVDESVDGTVLENDLFYNPFSWPLWWKFWVLLSFLFGRLLNPLIQLSSPLLLCLVLVLKGEKHRWLISLIFFPLHLKNRLGKENCPWDKN